MTPRQRVLKRIEKAMVDIESTINHFYDRIERDMGYLRDTQKAIKDRDLQALRYLVRKAKEGR